MDKELIKLKGTGDGVKICLSFDAPFADILLALQEKLRAWRKFFGTGHCNMYFTGRELTKSDKLRLEAIVGGLLPESTIIYGEKRGISDTTELPKDFIKELNKTHEPDADFIEESEDKAPSERDLEQFMAIKEVVTTNFKSNRARLYEGRVSSGRKVESDGHLVLIGDVEEGAELIASGNVVVLGNLCGKVSAGCMGNDKAYIIAVNMQPTDLIIANIHRQFDKNAQNKGFKKAFLTENEIHIDDFLVKPVDKDEFL